MSYALSATIASGGTGSPLRVILTGLNLAVSLSISIVYAPFAKGVAERNCPSLVVFRALTGMLLASCTTKTTPTWGIPCEFVTWPEMTFGLLVKGIIEALDAIFVPVTAG